MSNRIIKHYEGLHDGDLKAIGLQPKMDPRGIWTEGWGHAMVYNGKFLKGAANKTLAYKLSTIKTLDQADKQLEIDLQQVYLLMARKITCSLNSDQSEAVASFYYNCGYSETLTGLINQSSPKIYDWWISHYTTGGGVSYPGLVARRKSEALLFTTGVLKFFN